VRDEVADGRLVRWWIEGAQINWQLGLARLVGGYESPIHQTFLKLCRAHFGKSTASGQSRIKQKRKKAASV